MPRYFFDMIGGEKRRDDVGTLCTNDYDVPRVTMSVLPEVVKEAMKDNGDRRIFTVVVRDEGDRPIYSATMSFAGVWLRDRPNP